MTYLIKNFSMPMFISFIYNIKNRILDKKLGKDSAIQ